MFADNLKRIRKEHNLSQEALADMLNISRQAVSKWEQGTAYPEIETLIELSEKLGVSTDELLKGKVTYKNDSVEHEKANSDVVQAQLQSVSYNSETLGNTDDTMSGQVSTLSDQKADETSKTARQRQKRSWPKIVLIFLVASFCCFILATLFFSVNTLSTSECISTETTVGTIDPDNAVSKWLGLDGTESTEAMTLPSITYAPDAFTADPEHTGNGELYLSEDTVVRTDTFLLIDFHVSSVPQAQCSDYVWYVSIDDGETWIPAKLYDYEIAGAAENSGLARFRTVFPINNQLKTPVSLLLCAGTISETEFIVDRAGKVKDIALPAATETIAQTFTPGIYMNGGGIVGFTFVPGYCLLEVSPSNYKEIYAAYLNGDLNPLTEWMNQYFNGYCVPKITFSDDTEIEWQETTLSCADNAVISVMTVPNRLSGMTPVGITVNSAYYSFSG